MKPRIIVEREPSTVEWTLSEFFIDGVRSGVGVEDEHRDVKVFGETRIPAGVYELDLRHSPKFSGSYFVDNNGNISNKKDARFKDPHQLIWVKNVPGFEYILWHWGNTDLDSHGCYIIGSFFGSVEVVNPTTKKKEARRGVVSSRIKYVQVYPVIYNMVTQAKKAGEKVYVQYRDKVLV